MCRLGAWINALSVVREVAFAEGRPSNFSVDALSDNLQVNQKVVKDQTGISIMAGLKLPVNERKTRCLRCPDEVFDFLGYRIGRIHRPTGEGSYIGTRPSKASVQSISRRISEMTARRYGQQSPEVMVERLNRTMVGWANYFSLGHVGPAYRAISRHAVRRLRRWLGRKHQTSAGNMCEYRSPGYNKTTAWFV